MNRLLKTLWAMLLALHVSPLLALSSDREQPLYIDADRVDIDDAKGVSVYRGNVRITQGTMVITGDTVTAYHNKDHELVKAISIGKPATYRERQDGQDTDLKASAPRMEYDLDKEMVHLIGGGRVVQGKNTFEGEYIEYDIKSDMIRARSTNPPGTAPEAGTKPAQRIRVIFHPKDKGKEKGKKDEGKNGKKSKKADP